MSILIVFSTLIFASGTINVKDYIKDKFPAIFSFYLSSLDDLDLNEKEFIDLLEKLSREEQEYYAKEVYKNGFSLELLENVKEGKTIQEPMTSPVLPFLPKPKEGSIENLPTLIKRIEPSIVVIFTYSGKFDIYLKEKREEDILRLGSGFFISQNGDIITNYHVLKGAESAEVKTSDGKTYTISDIVAVDEKNDIIRLSVNIPSKYVLPLSLSETTPEIGERIIVYGSPLGLEKTLSDGIISAIREVPGYGKLIQITAPISPGSSGSPVLNMKGEVIGVATFQMVEGQNLNFAIPSERIASLNLMKEEKMFTIGELFRQEDKEKKDSDYIYEARSKANYFLDKKEYEKALSYFKILVKIDPLDSSSYFRIGFCYEKIEALEDAIEAYKQAIRIDPDDAIAYYNLGLTCIRLHYYAKAIEVFKQAIRIDPDFAEAHVGLGAAYLCIGDRNSALNEYKILKELDIDLANKLFDLIYE
ncbi:trypsin-like peptidase domain-containing protein [Patescibacteria group bacterium]|nr:trypsin-like peptidase domain-containing protein [Patescibacteria group bacterium]